MTCTEAALALCRPAHLSTKLAASALLMVAGVPVVPCISVPAKGGSCKSHQTLNEQQQLDCRRLSDSRGHQTAEGIRPELTAPRRRAMLCWSSPGELASCAARC